MRTTTGGCQCGKVRYDIDGAPVSLYVCHCRECRKQSASAFGISVEFKSADVRLVRGELRRWARPADSGRTVDCFFCATCGTRVWHGDKDKHQTISVKGGSLDEPVDLRFAAHIWTSRKLAGIVIPADARQYAEEPD